MKRGGDTPEPQTRVAVEFENNSFFYGYIQGDKFFVSTMDSFAVSVSSSGIVLDTQAFPSEMVFNEVADSLQNAGFDITSTRYVDVSVEVDEEIKGWNEYQIIRK